MAGVSTLDGSWGASLELHDVHRDVQTLACASKGRSVEVPCMVDILDDLNELTSSSMGDHGDSQLDVDDIHKEY